MSYFEPLPPIISQPGPGDRALVFCGGKVLLKQNALPLARELGFPTPEDALLVGRLSEQPCHAFELTEEPPVANALQFTDLRAALKSLALPLAAAIGRGRQLTIWQKTHRYCGSCGMATVHSATEPALICPGCGELFFPKIAPAIIVAVTKGDKILLAHNHKFRPGLYSTIAGFVEAGENLEDAVAREILEETGIKVKDIRYFGSQSWPFPNSMMVGFTAEYASGEITPDGVEIAHAAWFAKGQLPDIPSHGSISRDLIDNFLANH